MCPARPDSDSTHIRADRGGSSVRLGFSPRSGSESCPLPSSFRTPPQPFSPHPSPAPGPADKKAPEAPGQNMRKGNSKAGSAKAPLEKRRSTEAAGRRKADVRERRRKERSGADDAGRNKQASGMRENESSTRQKRRTKGGPSLQKTRKNAEGSGGNAADVRRAELLPVQELFALRITSSDAAMMSASAHPCRPESTSPRMRNPNSAAAAGSRLMSTP